MSGGKGRGFKVKVRYLLLGCLLSFSASASTDLALPFMDANSFTPYWTEEPSRVVQQPATVTPFQFTNQLGEAVTDSQMRGHVSLVNFFFTSCGSICPRLMSQVQKVQKKLASVPQARFYSFSVTPKRDTPERLSFYAKSRKLDLKNWDLITGNHEAIFSLGRGIFRADRNPDGTKSESGFIHSLAIYLVDPQLRIRGVYQSEKPEDMKLLVADAAKLAKESALNPR